MPDPDGIENNGRTGVLPAFVQDLFPTLLDNVRRYYVLFISILVIALASALAFYVFWTPTYTASAIIGAPDPSPATSMMNYGGIQGAGGIARSILGGAGGNDSFQEFQQLLQSDSIAVELADKDNLLPVIFHRDWDADRRQWKSRGVIHNMWATMMAALNRPVSDHPDTDKLAKFLSENLSVSQTPNTASTIASLGSGFVTVTFKFEGREQAQRLLNVILNRADNIIRQSELRDVSARVSYLRAELSNITQSDQRDSILRTLTTQEEIETMLVADRRFAFTLVSPPYSSLKPTFPPSPVAGVVIVFFASVFLWLVLLRLQSQSSIARLVVRWFNFGERGRKYTQHIREPARADA